MRGWIFDFNHTHALSLSSESLDACCIGAATFRGVVSAFRLERARVGAVGGDGDCAGCESASALAPLPVGHEAMSAVPSPHNGATHPRARGKRGGGKRKRAGGGERGV